MENTAKWKKYFIRTITVVVSSAAIILMIYKATDDYTHFHSYRVASVHQCAGSRHDVSCSVTLDNGKEVIVGSMTTIGYTVYQRCFIKVDDQNVPSEWCSNILHHTRLGRANDKSHNAAWARFNNQER